MVTGEVIMALDQGTTSSRTIIFDKSYAVRSISQLESTQLFPKPGWVEQNPQEIWENTLATAKQAMHNGNFTARDIAALGISNQRETTIVWDRNSGKPIYNAIIWQDRRTASQCEKLASKGLEPIIVEKTGLLLDPYFSSSKITWILDNVDGARSAADKGELAFGTVDSWLIWKLTNGARHATDITNASRTMLYNINEQEWDSDLLKLFGIPPSMLPEVLDCGSNFGSSDQSLFNGSINICGVAGDQQAAAMGQACFESGMLKATYGTGCFALFNTGSKLVRSQHKLLTTVASRINGDIRYALEGSIFCAGAAVTWLRDSLQIIKSPEEAGEHAIQSDPNQQIYMIPAFTGLGAPWWDPKALAAIVGMTLATGPKEIARAALESVCYQTFDLLCAIQSDVQNQSETILRVDGGMAKSDWTMQCLADILQVPIDRPAVTETSALGVAWLAASTTGAWPEKEEFATSWHCQQTFLPSMSVDLRDSKVAGWNEAVAKILSNN